MKKFFNRIKVSLTTLGVAMLSLFSKVMGQNFGSEFGMQMQEAYGPLPVQSLYGVPSSGSSSLISFIIKIVQRALIGVTFIVGIINLIKIKKTDDKNKKKRKVKKTIIILSILIILIIACFITTWLLK